MIPPAFRVHSFGEVPAHPHWRMPPHRHARYHELIVVLSGKMLLRTEGQEIEVERGDVLFYHSGLLHEEISQEKHPVHTLYFGFHSPARFANFPLRMQDTQGRVREMISWLRHDLDEGTPPAERIMLFLAIIEELRRLGPDGPNPWLEGVRAYLKDRYAEQISLADLASFTGMSRSAFARKFCSLAGHPPMKELRTLRLNEARTKILAGRDPLKAIAPAVGLGDEYQLSKLFRRQFGISPSEMRGRRFS